MKHITLALFLIVSVPAFSCDCKDINDLEEAQKREFQEGDNVFVGEVVTSDSNKGTYKIKIIEGFKGSTKSNNIVIGRFTSDCQRFPSREGEIWLIYANQLSDGAIELIGCGLSRPFNFPYIHNNAQISIPPPTMPDVKDKTMAELNTQLESAQRLQRALVVLKKEIEQLRKWK